MVVRPAKPARGSVRTRIVRLIESHGAIHKARLAHHLGVGWTTVQHHARVLVQNRVIREVAYCGRRFLLPARFARRTAERVIVLGFPEHRKALAVVARRPLAGIQDVARTLQCSRKTARRSLYALLRVGLAQKTDDYHPRFAATAAGRSQLRRGP